MEAPPQFPGAPKKSKTGLILGGLALAVVLCCCVCGGGFAYFFKDALKGGVGMVGCGTGIALQRDALLTYAEKNGGKLPPANTWQDSIKPYVTKPKDENAMGQTMRVPSPADDYCDQAGATSISYNSAIAGKKIADIEDKMGTIALFEVAGKGRNRSGAWAEAPYDSSPIIVMGQGRGWVRIPLKGEPAVMDKRGRIKPVPNAKGGASFNIEN